MPSIDAMHRSICRAFKGDTFDRLLNTMVTPYDVQWMWNISVGVEQATTYSDLVSFPQLEPLDDE